MHEHDYCEANCGHCCFKKAVFISHVFARMRALSRSRAQSAVDRRTANTRRSEAGLCAHVHGGAISARAHVQARAHTRRQGTRAHAHQCTHVQAVSGAQRASAKSASQLMSSAALDSCSHLLRFLNVFASSISSALSQLSDGC
eukprot:4484646-Pleurochrysis_carterae.AAC.1